MNPPFDRQAGVDDVNWCADNIYLKDHHLNQLPDSPFCPSLDKFFLQAPRLAVIPPTFFQHMPLLKVLDLSHSNIMSLPPSLASLTLLEEFILRDCYTLVELPPHIGMLTNLKLFDIQGTEIMYLPKEMANLKELQVLRFSLYDYAQHYIKIETAIPQKLISRLKNLKELSVFVPPEAQWWEEEVKDIQKELCDLEKLETLRWCLPTTESLQEFLQLQRRNGSLVYTNICNLMLTVGQCSHETSRLPHGLEEKFEEFKIFIKWINGEGCMDDVSKIMDIVEGLFLAQNWTFEKLSILNLTKLKYCVVAGCDEMETLVEAPPRIKNGEKVGLELLQYLSVHYMNKLNSIWKGQVGEDSLTKLRVLALHNCPALTSIFTLSVAQNLPCLIELTVEDCPILRSLVSTESHQPECGILFPRLERIFLIELPELEKIFGCGVIVEGLSTLLICYCPKLRSIDINELPHLKKIEGESEWWEVLDSDTSMWEEIFVPLTDDGGMITRVCEPRNSLDHFHETLLRGTGTRV